jgi:hypothetical protein
VILSKDVKLGDSSDGEAFAAIAVIKKNEGLVMVAVIITLVVVIILLAVMFFYVCCGGRRLRYGR